MISPKEIVGSNIKRIRLKKGLSGAELAERLLCSQQHISRIERGLTRLSVAQIYCIADCLNVNIQWLLEGVGFLANPLDRIYDQMYYFQAEDLF